jgi:hypothetical protein
MARMIPVFKPRGSLFESEPKQVVVRPNGQQHDDECGDRASRDEQHDGEDQADRGNARD